MDAATWDERYEGKDFVWTVTVNTFVERYLADLAATIEPAPGGAPTAIDLAAGEARNAVWLAGKGWDVTAVDFSSVGLGKGAALAARHETADGRPATAAIEFVVADATTWEPDEKVDLVLLSYFQLPTVERLAVLGKVAGWLRPGGVVFVIAHDQSNVEHGHGGPPSEEVCYDVDETVDALRAGTPEGYRLDAEVAEVARREVTIDDGTAVALDTLVMTRLLPA